MSDRARSFLRRLHRGERGTVTIFAAVGAIAFIGFGAITVDVGFAFHAKRVLQASADAASLAGAMQLSSGTPSQAVTAANTYSGGSGDRNANAYLTVTATPQTVKCTGTTGATCTADATSPNGIKVTETTTVPLYFARIFGASSIPMSVTSYALAATGKAQPVDAMVIVDTTASMNTTDGLCWAGASRLDCGLAGFRALLNGFTPPDQQVGLMLFPGLTSAANAALEYDCSATTPSSTAHYNASPAPVYLVVPLSSDYSTSGTLNTSSNLVKAARGGAAGCTAGVSAIGGSGTFYADVVTKAQSYLVANGRSGVNKMIILLSDGDANSSYAPTPTNECHQAITAASTAQTANTTVVTIAYGSPTAATPGSCSTDTTSISACDTLTKMATIGSGSAAAPQWFYSDATGGCVSGANSVTNLSAIFGHIAGAVTGSRLIPSS
jgi:Flp pilus assembly protein TadG